MFRLNFYLPNNVDLIQTICNDKRYFSICKDVGGSQHCEDLYQEAMCEICHPKMKERLSKAKEGGYLEVYVIGIINHFWTHRKDPKNALYRFTDNVEMWTAYKKENLSRHDKARTLTERAVKELSKKIKSENEDESLAAKLVWDVCKSNTHTVSKDNNTSFYQIKRRITPILKDLKKKLDE